MFSCAWQATQLFAPIASACGASGLAGIEAASNGVAGLSSAGGRCGLFARAAPAPMSVVGNIFAMSLWLSAPDGLCTESVGAGAGACCACAAREPERMPAAPSTTHNKAAGNNEITRMA